MIHGGKFSKSKSITILTLMLVVICAFGFMLKPKSKEKEVEKILNSESYSYLPDEAKNLVKSNYLENDLLVLTEKNQIADQPYLNPEYIDYLQKTEEEKKSQKNLPDVYVTNWSSNYPKLSAEEKESLPTSFDLRNYNGKNYITALKNQGNLGVCWAYATSEQAESFLILNNEKNKAEKTTISSRQIDYATSTDGIKDYENTEFGTRKLASGGSFLYASQPLVSGVSMVENNDEIFEEYGTEQLPLKDVLSFKNSLFEINQSAAFYMDSDFDPVKDEEEYRNNIKKLIMEKGGAIISTEAPSYPCGASKGENGSYFVRIDGECTEGYKHAMQIIGWDDDYEYSYCNKPIVRKGITENTHRSADQCTTETIYSTDDGSAKKGAWLVRNSWGESEYSYIYVTYDSLKTKIEMITDANSQEEKNWDNEYSKTYIIDQGNGSYNWGLTSYELQSYQRKTTKKEKLEKIKFYSESANAHYQIILNPNTEYRKITEINTIYPGYQTVDLSDQNIIEDDNEIEILIMGDYRAFNNYDAIIKNSMIIMTSNVKTEGEQILEDEDPSISSNKTETVILPEAENKIHSLTLNYKTDNIPSGEKINFLLIGEDSEEEKGYKILNQKDNNTYNFTVDNPEVAYNNANVKISIDDQIPNGVYSIVAYYGNNPLENDENPGVYVKNYFNKGAKKSEINYLTSNNDTTGLTKTKEIIDPITGKLYEDNVLTDKNLEGSKLELDEDHTFINWTKNEKLSETTAEENIITTDQTLIPEKIQNDFFNIYPSATYYANIQEKEITITYKTEINGLDDWNESAAHLWLKKEGSEEKIENELSESSIKILSGNPSKITASLTDDNSQENYYVFDGWYEGETVISTEKDFTPQKNSSSNKFEEKTYTAKWHVKKWGVGFISNNSEYGTISSELATNYPAPQILNWSDSIELTNQTQVGPNSETITISPAEPTAQYNYTFKDIVRPQTDPEENGTYELTVNFERNFNNYTITFQNYNGEEITKKEDYHWGDTIITPETPTREATAQYTYSFEKWVEKETGDELSESVEKDTIYIAKYTETVNKYTVTFDTNGSNQFIPFQIIEYGQKAEEPNVVVNEGLRFEGWYTDISEKDTKWNFDEDIITGDLELIAKWHELKQCTIKFETNGGSEINDIIVYEDSLLKDKFTNPTKEWYEIEGFYADSEFKTKWDIDKNKVVDDMTLYVKWKPSYQSWSIKTGQASVESTIITNITHSIDEIKSTIIFSNPNYPGSTNVLESDEHTQANSILKTGQYIKIYNIQNEEIGTVRIAVKGDLNGDGEINSDDLLKMKKHLLQISSLEGPYKESAYITQNDREINSGDILRIRQHLLNIKPIE